MESLDQEYAPIIIRDRDDFGSNRSSNRPLLELARGRMSRRTALKGFVTTAVVGALGGTLTSRVALAGGSSFGFESVPHTIADDMQVAPGYTAQVLIRWGDPVLPGAPAFDPMNQTADAQARQFGYNNDFVGYFPLPRGSDSSEHGLLHVNHEYTGQQLMFPGWTKEGADADAIGEASLAAQTPEQSAIEMMAHGGAVIEIIKENGRWRVVEDSQYARRITPETEMTLSGPAAGHELLKTSADPTGTKVLGTVNNCAGGKTPWGTVLMAEENFNGYFGGTAPETGPLAETYKRYGIPDGWNPWYKTVERFDVAKEPNEPHRFGWMVEYDPYDPGFRPGQAHRARPPQARGRHHDRQQGRPPGRLYRRRRALRLPVQVRLERHLRSVRRHREWRPVRRRHALCRQVRRRQVHLAAAGPGRGSADRRERLPEPG